jgi:polynucleotide 5'-kinase involved in rRNA processing
MSLIEKISVNSHYTRSVNLERDADSPAIVDGYIPTSRALQTLSRIADSMNADEAPRAWSLVGPYGSGKSSFAAFLTCMMANIPMKKTCGYYSADRWTTPRLL